MDDTKELILVEADSYRIRQEVIDRANYMINALKDTIFDDIAESEIYEGAFVHVMKEKGYEKDLTLSPGN